MRVEDSRQMRNHVEQVIDYDILGNVINKRKIFYDHLGNAFIRISDMCAYYNIPLITFRERLGHGISLKLALETPIRNENYLYEVFGKTGVILDCNGNKFNSINDMCKYHKTNPKSVLKRLNEGCSVEQSLISPNKPEKNNKKHETYMTIGHIKKEDKIQSKVVEDTFMDNRTKKTIVDHKGNKFNSITDMCDFYGIHPKLFHKRVKSGIERDIALESPMSEDEINICRKAHYWMDHKNHSFSSFGALCKFWNVYADVTRYKIRHGVPLDIALEIDKIPDFTNSKQ